MYATVSNAWNSGSDLISANGSICVRYTPPIPVVGSIQKYELARPAHISPPAGGHLVSGEAIDQVSTGGTLFANALSMAAGRAALLEILTEEAFERAADLGERMASGLRAAIEAVGLPWTVVQSGAHAAYFFAATAPRNGAESRAADDPRLRALMRVWLANRGVWESGWWLGPTVSLAHTTVDVDRYVALFGACLADIVG
mgnify:CR=1 FL=1